MSIEDSSLNLIRQTAIADTAIAALIESNIYLSELPSITSPNYPCISIDYDSGRKIMHQQGFKFVELFVWSYSSSSYREAKNVYDAFVDKFHDDRFFDTNVNIVMRESGIPSKHYDKDSGLYFYVSNWKLACSTR